MKILVTGGSGFVGLNVVEALLAKAHDVVAFGVEDLPEPARRIFRDLPGGLTFVRGNIASKEDVEGVVARHRPTWVFHGAAITAGPDREKRAPETIINVNVAGTVLLFEAARRYKVERVVYPSSLTVYGESLYDRPLIDERAPALPIGLYGITKYASERIALRYRDLWGIDVRCPRLAGVFGPWERDTGFRDMLGPQLQLALRATRGQSAVLPKSYLPRDWIYSRDVGAAIVALLETEKVTEPVVNLASGKDGNPAIADWAARLAAAYPAFRCRTAGDGEAPDINLHEARPRGLMDISRLTAETGYAPRFDMAAAFDDYLAWIKASPDALGA